MTAPSPVTPIFTERSTHERGRVVSTSQPGPAERRQARYAGGAVAFAAVMLTLAGAFQVVVGIAAIAKDEFFVVGREYAFELDVTAWGVIHVVLGALLVVAGSSLMLRKGWAAIVAVVMAALSAVANFFWLPYFPLWAIVIIAIDVWIIWALTRPGAVD